MIPGAADDCFRIGIEAVLPGRVPALGHENVIREFFLEKVSAGPGDDVLLYPGCPFIPGEALAPEDWRTTEERGTVTVSGAALVLAGGRPLLPVRLISENLNCEVAWDGMTRGVTITCPPP